MAKLPPKLREQLARAGRKGGKNGSRESKIKAGKASWKTRLKKYSL